jgi:ubiquinone/menaquinone biosynthesis C-methylase UbiE
MAATEQDNADRDRQYRLPEGALGRDVGVEMARDHLPENHWTVALLDARAGDRLLEIGFGPGTAVEALLDVVTDGRIDGVDHSELMVSEATRRNARAVASVRAELRYGDAARLPYADGTFDKVFSIHAVYFWPRPMDVLREALRVLKPGGTLLITMLPKERWPPNPPGSALAYGTEECTPYAIPELQRMMLETGFRRTEVCADADESRPSNFSVLATR